MDDYGENSCGSVCCCLLFNVLAFCFIIPLVSVTNFILIRVLKRRENEYEFNDTNSSEI